MKITTAGESHGKGLFAIIEGFPAGVNLDMGAINAALARRQGGYGRGARQKIECDQVEILSGVRNFVTLGSPITLAVWNRDFNNWKGCFAPEQCDTSAHVLTAVRPGHADLAGMQKFGHKDARNVLERASARETVVRVAGGEVCRQLLSALGIQIGGYVRSIGTVSDENEYSFEQLALCDADCGMLDFSLAERAKQEIEACRSAGDTLGGVCEIRVKNCKSGFGSCMTYSERLDARLAAAVMSVQGIKGVEIGVGFPASTMRGSRLHDEIYYDEAQGFYRKTNRAGGIEGGMSNGGEMILRAAMKPIPTLQNGLSTVDSLTKRPAIAAAERSDVCAVLACKQVLESVIASELAAVVLERLGGDTLVQVKARYEELP